MACAPDGSLYGDPNRKLHGHELDDLVHELPIPDGWKLVAVHGFSSLDRAA